MGENKIDITSTLLESTVEGAKGFLGKLLGASVEEYGLMLADNVKLKRFKNQLKMVNKAQKIVQESGINIKQISIKQLVPLLEYSSLEEDETLQDKWAKMLVNFIDSEMVYESSIFPFILSQLSSQEVKILDQVFDLQNKNHLNFYLQGIEKHNLIRLGLVEPTLNKKKLKTLYNYETISSRNTLALTELGIQFVNSCSRK